MTLFEGIAAIFGIINLLLIRQRSPWNFPFGIAAVCIFFWIFWQQKLYSDAGLQVFFAIVELYGWWAWSRNAAHSAQIEVKRLSLLGQLGCIVASLAAIFAWGFWMRANTDAALPFWDAAIAMLSVVGQILMTRRYIENWHWWIVVNIISIPVYFSRDLPITAVLYAIYLVLAIAGLIEWKRAEAKT